MTESIFSSACRLQLIRAVSRFSATLLRSSSRRPPSARSTGAFNFIFDPQLGIFTRSTTSFGPAFSSRSLTTGRNHFSGGFNYLHVGYDSYAGMNLRNGELSFVRNVQGPPQLPRDSALTLDLSSDTVVAFGNFGVTDNLDVGIVVPWIRVSMSGQMGLFNAAGVDLTGGSLRIPRATSTGIGDVSITGKYRVLRQGEGGVAAIVQVHLPTGDPNNLRGVGLTRTMIGGAWSMGGRVSPHVNLGYDFWSDGIGEDPEIKNQAVYALGAEFQVTPKVTAVLDLVGRRLFGAGGYYYASGSVGPATSRGPHIHRRGTEYRVPGAGHQMESRRRRTARSKCACVAGQWRPSRQHYPGHRDELDVLRIPENYHVQTGSVWARTRFR